MSQHKHQSYEGMTKEAQINSTPKQIAKQKIRGLWRESSLQVNSASANMGSRVGSVKGDPAEPTKIIRQKNLPDTCLLINDINSFN
jgi:hypothetical protein